MGLVVLSLRAPLLSGALADEADVVLEGEVFGLVVSQRRMEAAARADLRLVELQGQECVALSVVPLDLAGDRDAEGATIRVVLVLVPLLRLPSKEPLLADA